MSDPENDVINLITSDEEEDDSSVVVDSYLPYPKKDEEDEVIEILKGREDEEDEEDEEEESPKPSTKLTKEELEQFKLDAERRAEAKRLKKERKDAAKKEEKLRKEQEKKALKDAKEAEKIASKAKAAEAKVEKERIRTEKKKQYELNASTIFSYGDIPLDSGYVPLVGDDDRGEGGDIKAFLELIKEDPKYNLIEFLDIFYPKKEISASSSDEAFIKSIKSLVDPENAESIHWGEKILQFTTVFAHFSLVYNLDLLKDMGGLDEIASILELDTGGIDPKHLPINIAHQLFIHCVEVNQSKKEGEEEEEEEEKNAEEEEERDLTIREWNQAMNALYAKHLKRSLTWNVGAQLRKLTSRDVIQPVQVPKHGIPMIRGERIQGVEILPVTKLIMRRLADMFGYDESSDGPLNLDSLLKRDYHIDDRLFPKWCLEFIDFLSKRSFYDHVMDPSSEGIVEFISERKSTMVKVDKPYLKRMSVFITGYAYFSVGRKEPIAQFKQWFDTHTGIRVEEQQDSFNHILRFFESCHLTTQPSILLPTTSAGEKEDVSGLEGLYELFTLIYVGPELNTDETILRHAKTIFGKLDAYKYRRGEEVVVCGKLNELALSIVGMLEKYAFAMNMHHIRKLVNPGFERVPAELRKGLQAKHDVKVMEAKNLLGLKQQVLKQEDLEVELIRIGLELIIWHNTSQLNVQIGRIDHAHVLNQTRGLLEIVVPELEMEPISQLEVFNQLDVGDSRNDLDDDEDEDDDEEEDEEDEYEDDGWVVRDDDEGAEKEKVSSVWDGYKPSTTGGQGSAKGGEIFRNALNKIAERHGFNPEDVPDIPEFSEKGAPQTSFGFKPSSSSSSSSQPTMLQPRKKVSVVAPPVALPDVLPDRNKDSAAANPIPDLLQKSKPNSTAAKPSDDSGMRKKMKPDLPHTESRQPTIEPYIPTRHLQSSEAPQRSTEMYDPRKKQQMHVSPSEKAFEPYIPTRHLQSSEAPQKKMKPSPEEAPSRYVPPAPVGVIPNKGTTTTINPYDSFRLTLL